MPNMNNDLNRIATHILRLSEVSQKSADTYIQSPELTTEGVLGLLGYQPDAGDDTYSWPQYEYATKLLDDLQEHMAKCHVYHWPRPSVAVDMVIFGLDFQHPIEPQLNVLLIKRGIDPFKKHWAIPGGFVNENEDPDDAARRELKEETHAEVGYVEQLQTFGKPGRDPRGHMISIAYMALVRTDSTAVHGGDDATQAMWWPVSALPELDLAFDHAEILEVALKRLRTKVRWQPLGIDLLPESFSIDDLQRVYEAVLDTKFNRGNFRTKVLSYGVLVSEGSRRISGAPGRPPELWRFDRDAYEALTEDFEV